MGTEACTNGSWTTCEVPVAQRVCTNDCGAGSQTCRGGAWSVCTVPEAVRSCAAPCGPGQETCIDGGWGACDGPEAGAPVVTAQFRDFQYLIPPDFGGASAAARSALDFGIVAPVLGADDTPVYAGNPTTPSTHGAADFEDWYHDTPVNRTTRIALPFGPLPGDPDTYASENPAFFPLDNQLFGNETPMGAVGPSHNYYFTAALALPFRYRGGETFRFASDDDSWVFINRKLAVNLGGLHETLRGAINLDASSLGLAIEVGQIYTMNIFYADRQPVSAVLDIEVPAADFAVCSDGGLP
jgi:fibro-slime domain-containing protein